MRRHHSFGEEQQASLWRQARIAGMSRRRFLSLLAGGGAAAILSACQSKIPAATPPTPPSTSNATQAPQAKAIYKPIPEAFFNQLGSNAEMRFEVMEDRAYATPNSFFFVRNHSTTPLIDIKTWKLRIEGDGVETPVALTYDDILGMEPKSITRFVECAGNGRGFFGSLMNRPAEGGQWRLGAYGVAEWTGVPLGDILDRAGIKKTAVDVMPTGLDSLAVERPMPVTKAIDQDTILAYLMNGDILGLDHGFPVRVIAPGWVGINSIKWVGKITVSEKPIFVDKNTKSYVLVGPDYQPQPPADGPVIYEQTLKSACALPWPARLNAGAQKVTGYAWSAHGRIARVEVSLDGGQTYSDATLVGSNTEKAGSRWEFSFNARPGEMTVTPRATDDKGNTQHGVSQQKWNKLGYLFGAVVPHPVTVLS